MAIRDHNGKAVYRNVRRDPANGQWLAEVWFGGGYGQATTLRTYRYATREAARNADISDQPGKAGCIG